MKKILSTFLLFSLFTAQAGWFDAFYSGSKKAFSVSKRAVSEPAVSCGSLAGFLARNERSYYQVSDNPIRYELKRDQKILLRAIFFGAAIGSTFSLITGLCKGVRAEKGKGFLDFTHKERVRRTLLWLCTLSFVSWHDQLTFKQTAISLIAIPIIDKAVCSTLGKVF